MLTLYSLKKLCRHVAGKLSTVKLMRIGIIAIQGDVSEHIDAVERALCERDIGGEVLEIRHEGIVPRCDAVILPGGESTTLGRLIEREGIAGEIQNAAKNGIPVLGTCAGLILVATRGDEQVHKTHQHLLGLMDVKVNRNAFGRQRESFEINLDLAFLDSPYTAIFIRAPAIMDAGPEVDVLSTINGRIVAARQNNVLALAFHPELTPDLRLHHYFLDMISVT
ncbi:MAG: glutamine amidotransferase [Methanohalophilus sp.]|nr:MAG: glutamine amidotransferase [Methanohalophilus sp. 2-GBenrich]RSD34070.1 MAG: glutamine amidotransferase [Methanohalophilus sp.]RSD34241.1 MAG: glutamine amidotransferase [Methanohalophilus sp.]